MENNTIYYDDLLGIGFVMLDKDGNKMNSDSVFNTGDYTNFAYLECKINDTLSLRFKDNTLYLFNKENDSLLELLSKSIENVIDLLKKYQSFDSFTSISYLESLGFCFGKDNLGSLELNKDYFINFFENEFYLSCYHTSYSKKIKVDSKTDLLNYINDFKKPT